VDDEELARVPNGGVGCALLVLTMKPIAQKAA